MYLFELEFLSFSDICPGVGLQEHMEALFLAFSHLFFFLNYYLFIYLFAVLLGLWDLSSPTRDRTPALSSQSAEL